MVRKMALGLGVLVLGGWLLGGPYGCSSNSSPAAPVTVVVTATPVPGLGVVWHQALANLMVPPTTQFTQRAYFSSAIYNGSLWIMAGDNNGGNAVNDVWKSADGKNWTNVLADNSSPSTAQFTQRILPTSVAYNTATGSGLDGALWVIGGSSGPGTLLNDVWRSPDGMTWSKVLANTASPPSSQFSQRDLHASVVFNGALWVLGGASGPGTNLNDAWNSTDGANWVNVLPDTGTPANQFTRRFGLSVAVFNGALWVVGGSNGSHALNDVWNSTDGVNWGQVLADTSTPGTTQFSERDNAGLVAYNGALWVIGGNNNGTLVNDVWSSMDGSHWTQQVVHAPFAARQNFGAQAFNSSLWVFGGVSPSFSNDVWYSP